MGGPYKGGRKPLTKTSEPSRCGRKSCKPIEGGNTQELWNQIIKESLGKRSNIDGDDEAELTEADNETIADVGDGTTGENKGRSASPSATGAIRAGMQGLRTVGGLSHKVGGGGSSGKKGAVINMAVQELKKPQRGGQQQAA